MLCLHVNSVCKKIAFVDRLLEATPYRNGNVHERTRQRLEKDFALSRLKAKHRQNVDKAQVRTQFATQRSVDCLL